VSELERTLTELGRELAVPTAPDLAAGVLARIEPRRAMRPRHRHLVLAFAVVALAALAATLAIPDARSALFRVLHIGGEQIELVDELPPVPPQPAEIDLDLALGTRATLEQARRQAGFDLRELDTEPDRVYLGGRGTVWFLYGTPQNVRLLIAQTPRVTIDEPFILKKLVASGTPVEQLSIGGARGFYLGGKSPHFVLLLDENGDVIEESARLARNVLVWEANGVAYRLEGEFTRDEALRLGRSLR
jgi:hypothetical protein